MPPATLTRSLDSRLLDGKIAHLEKIVQELRDKLAESQRAANQQKDCLDETIKSLRSLDKSSSASISTETDVPLTPIISTRW